MGGYLQRNKYTKLCALHGTIRYATAITPLAVGELKRACGTGVRGDRRGIIGDPAGGVKCLGCCRGLNTWTGV